MLAVSLVFAAIPGTASHAAGAEGETEAAASELQDENSQRLEEVTAMDEDGSIYEIGETDGTVSEDTESTEESIEEGIAAFSLRSISPQVVNFNTKGNDTTIYTDDTNGGSGYTNGAYGADAAYLGTTSDGKIRFMLSGVTGTVSASEVELVNYDEVADNVSYYTVSGGKLIHYISQNLNSSPTSNVNNGPAPSYLSEGGKYYSYDGQYFYTDYATMISDYQSGANGASAVNAGNPFTNYFQFLDMNSLSAYSGDELNSLLNTAMENAWVDPSSSKLTGTGTSFVNYQNTYSVNALLSLGIAINESAWGTSNICQTKNNIFGLNAVDGSPDDASVYASVDDCIRGFMHDWMANGYLSSSDWRNHGKYLGNKGGGINVSYASDPYWGEKAAALAWNLDTLGGNRDYLGTGSAEVPDTAAPDTSADASGADNTTSDPGTTTPDTTVGDTGADTSGADSTTSDPVTPDTSDSGTTAPDTTTPDTPEPDTTVSDSTTVPDATTPDNTGSNTDTTVPDAATPDNSDTTVSDSDSTTTGSPATDTPATDVTDTTTATTVSGTGTTTTDGATDNTTSGASSVDTSSTSSSAAEASDPKSEPSDTDKGSKDKKTVAPSDSTTNGDAKATNTSGAGNTSADNSKTASSPKTGDSTDTMLWIALLGSSLIVLTAASAVRFRKRTTR